MRWKSHWRFFLLLQMEETTQRASKRPRLGISVPTSAAAALPLPAKAPQAQCSSPWQDSETAQQLYALVLKVRLVLARLAHLSRC